MPIDPAGLGPTLIHEHIFVRNFELEVNLPDPEWAPRQAVQAAVAGLDDLFIPGSGPWSTSPSGPGRDVSLVAEVANQVPVHLVASTGWYTPNVLPTYFQFHGPGRAIEGPERSPSCFVRDITEGISGTRCAPAC